MTSTTRRLRHPSPVALLAVLALATLASPAIASADSTYRQDLYFRDGYERQVNARTCIAASTAMMVNFAIRQDLNLPQGAILRYAQSRDALNDEDQRGSDPLGWSEALTYYSSSHGVPAVYAWQAFDREIDALRAAAVAIAWSGKPVGLTVDHGRHAVVMTGFEASSHPLRNRPWSLRSVAVSDPYGYRHRWYAPATSSPLNTYRELDATREYDRAWYGKFIIVVPVG